MEKSGLSNPSQSYDCHFMSSIECYQNTHTHRLKLHCSEFWLEFTRRGDYGRTPKVHFKSHLGFSPTHTLTNSPNIAFHKIDVCPFVQKYWGIFYFEYSIEFCIRPLEVFPLFITIVNISTSIYFQKSQKSNINVYVPYRVRRGVVYRSGIERFSERQTCNRSSQSYLGPRRRCGN